MYSGKCSTGFYSMKYKIIIALFVTCLSLQGCTKKEITERLEAIQSNFETKVNPDTQIIEQGQKALENNGLDAFQMELNRNAPNGHTYIALSADQIKFLGKETNGLFTYTWKLRFQETATENIMGCDSDKVSWNKDNNEIIVSLASHCFNVLKQGNLTPTETETETETSEISETSPLRLVNIDAMTSVDDMSIVNLQSTADVVTINNVVINRGNCALLENIFPLQVRFGGVIPIRNKCHKNKIIEVLVSTDQGDWTFSI